MGGLASGAILARNGYKVTVLEQNAQVGGCLQCFSRKGVVFETGMHFIGSADKGQILHSLLHYLGIYDKLQLSRLDTAGYDVVSLAGSRFAYANGREPFIEQLSSYFPGQSDNLNRYFDAVGKVAAASSVESFKASGSNYAINTEYQLRSADDVLDEIFDNALLKSVLMGTLPLYSAVKGRTPFARHAFIMDFYNKSAFRIVGGSDIIAKSLVEKIGQYGGEVLTGKRVEKIICNDTRATGIRTSDGESYDADIVISAIHPARTLELTDSKLIRPAYRSRVMGMKNTPSVFSLYLIFKENMVPYMNHNFYSYSSDNPWGSETYSEAEWPKSYLYMHSCHSADASYAKSATVLSYMDIKELKAWENTFVEKRGDDYRAFKREKAEILIDRMEREFPGIRECIAGYYTSTPLTYRDYTGTQDGSIYGLAQDISEGISGRVSYKTKIPNLLLTGQNINSHGILGVLVGAVVTCSELLPAGHIYKQILDSDK